MTSDPFSLSVVSPSLRKRWGLVAACSVLMAMSSDVWYTAPVFFVALMGSGSAHALWHLYVTHSILSALGLAATSSASCSG
jgi:hypothetical protein